MTADQSYWFQSEIQYLILTYASFLTSAIQLIQLKTALSLLELENSEMLFNVSLRRQIELVQSKCYFQLPQRIHTWSFAHFIKSPERGGFGLPLPDLIIWFLFFFLWFYSDRKHSLKHSDRCVGKLETIEYSLNSQKVCQMCARICGFWFTGLSLKCASTQCYRFNESGGHKFL